MEISPLVTRTAIKILSFKTTEGSAPIEVLCDDDEIYFAKTTNYSTEPHTDLICEILGIYYARIWGLKTAESCLIDIPLDIVEDYLKENEILLPKRYSKTKFDEIQFFGVKLIPNAFETDSYINGLNSLKEFNLFNSPLDLIKIGILDSWLGNKDRKPNNPNILLSTNEGKIDFFPIDFAACFGYAHKLKILKPFNLDLEGHYSILNSGFAISVLKMAKNKVLLELSKEISIFISNSIKSSNQIFDLIPKSWGFSKDAKKNTIFVLSDSERNKKVENSFLIYKPKK